jgi:hypothetical protein
LPSVKSGIATRAPLRSRDNLEQKMRELQVAASERAGLSQGRDDLPIFLFRKGAEGFGADVSVRT